MGITREYFDIALFPNVARGHNYAFDVVEGKIPNSKYMIGACKRYISDLEKGIYPFKPEVPERFLKLAQRFLHINGEWKTPNVVYEPWQCWIYMNILGFYDTRTNYRRYRTAYLEVARGNGKSVLASILVLYFLALDNPKGNEISCFASKADQARIVLDSSRAMARANSSFIKATGTDVRAHSIVHDSTNSIVRARSSDHGSLDGLKDILSIIDELHAVNRELYDVVVSGMKKRRDSLLHMISTAGFNVEGVGHDQSLYAKKIAMGDVEDDTFFGAVYTVDEGDDIFSETTWMKANPNYGISVDPIGFAAAANKVKETPSELANFKVKHLNMWLSEYHAFFDTQKWDKCADPDLSLEDFRGEKCYVGVDLASKVDLTSLGFVFKREDTYYLFDRSYIPENTVREARNVLYDNSIGKGHLIATPGEAINYDNIFKEVMEYTKKYKVQEVLLDPWNATEFMQKLMAARVETTEFRMTTANLSEPTKALDALIRQGKIRHNGSPLLRWCVGNVVCKMDAAENVYPRKSHEKLKIDPVIALLFALAAWIQKEQKESVYQTRGIRVL